MDTQFRSSWHQLFFGQDLSDGHVIVPWGRHQQLKPNRTVYNTMSQWRIKVEVWPFIALLSIYIHFPYPYPRNFYYYYYHNYSTKMQSTYSRLVRLRNYPSSLIEPRIDLYKNSEMPSINSFAFVYLSCRSMLYVIGQAMRFCNHCYL